MTLSTLHQALSFDTHTQIISSSLGSKIYKTRDEGACILQLCLLLGTFLDHYFILWQRSVEVTYFAFGRQK